VSRVDECSPAGTRPEQIHQSSDSTRTVYSNDTGETTQVQDLLETTVQGINSGVSSQPTHGLPPSTGTGVSLTSPPTTSISPLHTLQHKLPRNLLVQVGSVQLLTPTSFDGSKPVVVLVHGALGIPMDLSTVGLRMEERGFQPVYVRYDDQGVATHINAYDLAQALMKLRSKCTGKCPSLTLVGHSMGGVVSLAALRTLEDANWYGTKPDFTPIARAGFDRVHLRSIDTPWDGAPTMGTDDWVVQLFARLGVGAIQRIGSGRCEQTANCMSGSLSRA